MNMLDQNQYELQNAEHYSNKKTKTNLGNPKRNVIRNNKTDFGNDIYHRKNRNNHENSSASSWNRNNNRFHTNNSSRIYYPR